MGPDHSQVEIYHESKHGVLFNDQVDRMNLHASPKSLTTAGMPVPTCATCHLSGLNGLGMTHDTTERLSWLLYAPVSEKRSNYQQGQDAMQATCRECHTSKTVTKFYDEAEGVVLATNNKVEEALALIAAARAEGLLTPELMARSSTIGVECIRSLRHTALSATRESIARVGSSSGRARDCCAAGRLAPPRLKETWRQVI